MADCVTIPPRLIGTELEFAGEGEDIVLVARIEFAVKIETEYPSADDLVDFETAGVKHTIGEAAEDFPAAEDVLDNLEQ